MPFSGVPSQGVCRRVSLAPTLKIALLLLSALAAGCGGGPSNFSTSGGGGTGNSANVTLAVTGNGPSGVSILSFEATITSVSLMSSTGSSATLISSASPVTLELARLAGDSTIAASASIPTGTYNNITISIANPTITFQNNSGSSITVGSVTCAVGATCQVSPSAAANVVITTAPFPLTVTAGTAQNFILNFNLANILSPAFAVNFSAGINLMASATSSSSVVTSIEDQVGQVTAIDVAHESFTFVTSENTFKVNVDSNTAFNDFLGGGCGTANIGCLAANQAVAVNMNLMGDGSVLATGVTFEDSNVNEPLTEGVISSIDSSTQFHMVVLDSLPASNQLAPGTIAIVTMSGITTFSIDDEGLATSAFSFISASNLVVGQEVQVKDLSTSLGSQLQADRIRLRASRVTATVGTIASPNFNLTSLPSLFTNKSFAQIQVRTSNGITEFAGTTPAFANLSGGMSATVRGQIFLSSGSLVMPASKVTGSH